MPDEDAFFHRLDVDVARLALDGALHDEIDEIDNRRGFAPLLETRDWFEDFLFSASRQRGFACRLAAWRAAARARRRCRGDGEVARRLGGFRQSLVGIAGLDRFD